jgi:hypothetical protein
VVVLSAQASSEHFVCIPSLCHMCHMLLHDLITALIGRVQIMHFIYWVPCNHGMMCPRFADGGEGLQIWKVSVNIFNKQLQTVYIGSQTWILWNNINNKKWT